MKYGQTFQLGRMNWPVNGRWKREQSANRQGSRHRETNGERTECLAVEKDSKWKWTQIKCKSLTTGRHTFLVFFSAANFRVSSIGALTVSFLSAAITGQWEVRRRPEMENVSMDKSERFKVETFFGDQKIESAPSWRWLASLIGPKLKYHRQVAEMFQLIHG